VALLNEGSENVAFKERLGFPKPVIKKSDLAAVSAGRKVSAGGLAIDAAVEAMLSKIPPPSALAHPAGGKLTAWVIRNREMV
jgi:hypothetical protein